MKYFKRLLLFLSNQRIKILLDRKLRLLIKANQGSGEEGPKISRELKRSHYLLWKDYSPRINYGWLKLYTRVSGIADHRYIPESIYYTDIEPRLNNKLFSKAWTDKNNLSVVIGDWIKTADVVLRCMDGILYSAEMKCLGSVLITQSLQDQLEGSRLIIKPTLDSGGGKAVRVFTVTKDGLAVHPPLKGAETLHELMKSYDGNFIIQKYIDQHPFFARFNGSSINTIRVLTYRSLRNEEIVILHKLLRIGRPGSVVDNQASGGLACSIDKEGRLMPYGIDKKGAKYSGTESLEFGSIGIVPFILEIEQAAHEVARSFRYSRLLGLDFAVNSKGEVILIEVNDTNNEINFFQLTSGPLFGEYTDEVASLCRHRPRSFIIDYII